MVKIKEVPLITPKNEVKGTEFTVYCPLNVANVNVKKSCSKCPAKIKMSIKNMELECKIYNRQKDQEVNE